MKVMTGFTPPPSTIALGVKPQATVASKTAKDTVQADSFTASTSASKGTRSGFLYIDAERFEGTAADFFENLVEYFCHVLNGEGISELKKLVNVCEKHSEENLYRSILDSVYLLIHSNSFGKTQLLNSTPKRFGDESINTTLLNGALQKVFLNPS